MLCIFFAGCGSKEEAGVPVLSPEASKKVESIAKSANDIKKRSEERTRIAKGLPVRCSTLAGRCPEYLEVFAGDPEIVSRIHALAKRGVEILYDPYAYRDDQRMYIGVDGFVVITRNASRDDVRKFFGLAPVGE
ncbi:MAG: hypothetical protein A3I44_03800 [Candidatus Sungbacteria bacterium RIFCSPLOWO2_02_FULL_51_17]|uniref:Uncharacterized protein n=1 Tax=Candidatus Sungbacteria bacterium RIFCSPHIGHO2_02_FULL_51_29 TaxID=1802273 RepID=A0A1G2KQ02_9BACT|nr:MAG: hypothetical protein A2676_02320 [Candidatus Sungbacteria bacterium RIFCSPHIGHO2_01_FULL_51_22]OHA01485.1 MAG: hypothetical protein A3C16_05565 [Candidatus Sungbacteria bacterium RIFCSPHIGHO2_02_FULL_51_29]OHA06981.1 MAG: hypothetical protein A3B29_00270 [Candidatus Sungbacteria bacterium RIFCSPLOWO2_01_FULL_51_34]OHA11210.1 MAG: hypothetical protein A3I44_03800 [Candidatus Sungbacteria bacterium RIFCSPLOWO2_02_FULL_51_17]